MGNREAMTQRMVTTTTLDVVSKRRSGKSVARFSRGGRKGRRRDEPLLCVSGLFKNVACFDPKTLVLRHTIPTPKKNHRVIAIPSKDEREEELIAVGEWGDHDSEVLLHSPHHVDSPIQEKLSTSHSSRVCGLSYISPKLVVSGSSDHTQLVVSDVNTGEKVMDLLDAPECTATITTASSPLQEEGGEGEAPQRGNGFVFVGGGTRSDSDQSIRHYDLGRSERANEVVQMFKGHSNFAHGLGYSAEKNLLFSSSYDKTLRIWSIHRKKCLKKLQLLNWNTSLLFDPRKRLIFCGNQRGIIEVWDYRKTKKRVRNFNHPTKEAHMIWDLSQAGDGTYASIGDDDYSVATWTDAGKILATAKTSGKNRGVCYVCGSTSPDALRSDYDDRLAFLLKMCYTPPTESVRVAGCLVGRGLLC